MAYLMFYNDILQRTGYRMGPTVNFSLNMVLNCKKEEFLSNNVNKQRFINLLGIRLKADGCTVDNAKGDADVLIVQTAIESARSINTIVVGDDTDLLVLLCYHFEINSQNFFLSQDLKRTLKQEELGTLKRPS